MREVHVREITKQIRELCIRANVVLPEDVRQAICAAKERETNAGAANILEIMKENMDIAAEGQIAVCQDTGMAIVFIELGQEVHLVGGTLDDAVNEGVRQGYEEGYLRKSIVRDPLRRVNTGDNTPAVLHLSLVPGDRVKLTVAPKGFGSENMSALRMFTPAASQADIEQFVVDTVLRAGSNPCPPVIVGVGIGGSFERCAYLAKRALVRSIAERNPDPYYAEMEARILEALNRTDIGPQGFGGVTTALAVNIEVGPTHIAGLPAAVNMGCHVTRHASATI